MKVYNFILQGHEATTESARIAAMNLDWQSTEKTEIDKLYAHSSYYDNINGIDIYYCYGADYYFFADADLAAI